MSKKTLVAVIAALLVAFAATAQTTTMQKTVTSTAPTVGNPAVSYTWDISTDAGATWVFSRTSTGPATTLTIPILVPVICRVAAIDALGHQGAWSLVSDPYTGTLGNPGACGKPVWQ